MARNLTANVVRISLAVVITVLSLLRPTHQSRILLSPASCQDFELADVFPDDGKVVIEARQGGSAWIVNDADGRQWSLNSENVSLCAGRTYSITVRFIDPSDGAPQKRWALLTTSAGSWGHGGAASRGAGGITRGGGDSNNPDGAVGDTSATAVSVRVGPRSCGNRVRLGAPGGHPQAAGDSRTSSSYNLTLTLPCDATVRAPEPLLLVLTSWSGCTAGSSGSCDSASIRMSNLSVTLDPSCAAAAAAAVERSSCGPPLMEASPPLPPPPPPPQPPRGPAGAVSTPATVTSRRRLSSSGLLSPLPPPPSPALLPPPTPSAAAPVPVAAPRAPTAAVAVAVTNRRPPLPPTFPPRPSAPPAACHPSSLNYACSVSLGRVRLHWTVGGAAPPPNRCTGPQPRPLLAAAPAAVVTTPVSSSQPQQQEQQQQQLVHFAVEAAAGGYVSLGFPEDPAEMSPADIVLGWVNASGTGTVNAYHITAKYVSPRDVVNPSWALGAAVVQDVGSLGENGGGKGGGGGGGPRTTLCFSRAVEEPAVKSSSRLDLITLKYSWAISSRDALMIHSAGDFGAGVLDLTTGAATTETASIDRQRAAIIAHGVLMSIAWVLLLPLGVMAPAHRWLFRGRTCGSREVWFWIHVGLQLSGLALFVVAFALALALFSHTPGGSLRSAHAVMGYLVAALSGLQLVGVLFKPKPVRPRTAGSQQQQQPPPQQLPPSQQTQQTQQTQTQHQLHHAAAEMGPQHQQEHAGKRDDDERRRAWVRRYLWNPLHRNGGRASILVAWAAVLTGIALHHQSPVYAAPIVPWVVPIVIAMGLLLLANGCLLDVSKDTAVAVAVAVTGEAAAREAAAGAVASIGVGGDRGGGVPPSQEQRRPRAGSPPTAYVAVKMAGAAAAGGGGLDDSRKR